MIHQFRLNSPKAVLFGLLIATGVMCTSCAPRYGCYYGMTPTPADTDSYTNSISVELQTRGMTGTVRFDTENTGFGERIDHVGEIHLCHVAE